jgi:hypothetical protein
MRPTDLEDYLAADPLTPIRLTLSSGDQLVVDEPRRSLVAGMSLALAVPDENGPRGVTRLKLVSIPNIVLVERVDPRQRRNGRRRR